MDHPPLPSQSSLYKSSIEKEQPPLPFGVKERVNINKDEKNTCELTLQNLQKFNKKTLSQNLSVVKVLPNAIVNQNHDMIRQTIGIPQENINEIKNDNYEARYVVHNYPLASGSIPSLNYGNKFNLNSQLNTPMLPTTTAFVKKESTLPVNSILTNTSNIPTTSSNKKESGEKNKVKFSDTITVAVVPEISRKEKINNFNERVKRKTIYPPSVDPIRKELAESLPLCHPNQDYLKDFMPANTDKLKNGEEKKGKSSIKVVNLGIL